MSKLNVKRVCIKTPSVKKLLAKSLLEPQNYPNIIYIGRAILGGEVSRNSTKAKGYPQLKGSPLANPYYINADGTREEVVEKYRRWLWEQVQSNTEAKEELSELLKNIQFRQEVNEEPLRLACWCRENEKCHGDVVVNCLNWMNDTQIVED